jgi:hypothetical protein
VRFVLGKRRITPRSSSHSAYGVEMPNKPDQRCNV